MMGVMRFITKHILAVTRGGLPRAFRARCMRNGVTILAILDLGVVDGSLVIDRWHVAVSGLWGECRFGSRDD